MVKASATETVDLGSISDQVKPKSIKFTDSLQLNVQQKGQCDAFTVCGKQVGTGQLDSKGRFAVSQPRQLGKYK